MFGKIPAFVAIALFGAHILSFSVVEGQQQQFFAIFNQSGCPAAAQIANHTNTGTTNVNASSTLYYRVNGLWTNNQCNATVCDRNDIMSGAGTGCTSLGVRTNRTSWRLTRYGDAAQNDDKFVYFPQTYLEGTPSEVTSANPGITQPTLNSYYFFGRSSWELFTQPNYGGTATCLNYSSPTAAMSYNPSFSRTVLSIRRGCGGTTVPTTTTTTMRPTGTTTIGTTRNTTTGSTTRTTPKTNGASSYELSVIAAIGIFFSFIATLN